MRAALPIDGHRDAPRPRAVREAEAQHALRASTLAARLADLRLAAAATTTGPAAAAAAAADAAAAAAATLLGLLGRLEAVDVGAVLRAELYVRWRVLGRLSVGRM